MSTQMMSFYPDRGVVLGSIMASFWFFLAQNNITRMAFQPNNTTNFSIVFLFSKMMQEERKKRVNLHCLFPRLHSAVDHCMSHPTASKGREGGFCVSLFFQK